MARNRMIKVEFWESEKNANLSITARLFFISLWNFADDEGYLENKPKWIKIKCFPYDDVNIEELLQELKNNESIDIKNGIIKIINFNKHQVINKKIASNLKDKYESDTDTQTTDKTPLPHHYGSSTTPTPDNSHNKIEIEIENKININKNNIKEKINKREKELPEQTAVPDSPKVEQIELLPAPETEKPKKIAKPRKVTPQEIVVQYFAEKYKQLTGIDYLATEKDYSIVGKKLIPKYNIELIKQKIDWLVVGCTHPKVYWFAKDINNFLIGTLEKHWNEILPVLTDEQKKEQEKKKKEAERKAKVMAELAKQGIKIAETAQNSTEVGHVRV